MIAFISITLIAVVCIWKYLNTDSGINRAHLDAEPGTDCSSQSALHIGIREIDAVD